MKAGKPLAVFASGWLLASSATPCCVAYGQHPISLVGEKVIIVWNPDLKVQHFVRQASFRGEAKEFGFIVPTPGEPEVSVADAAAFQKLERLIPPPPASRGDMVSAAAEPPSKGVNVIREERVGDYMAAILQATDGASMVGWLKQNGYQSRPAMEEWLDHYAKQRWYFAALKFVREEDSTDERTSALRVSFKTDTPHYPYKMPSDTWPKGHIRPLALYFVGPDAAKAVFRGSQDAWEARKIWTGSLPERARHELARDIRVDASDIPAGAQVTIFRNVRNASGYDRDLDFLAAGPLSEGIPPSLYALGGGVAAVAVGAVWMRRRRLNQALQPAA